MQPASSPLFDVAAPTARPFEDALERVALDQFELAPNPRRENNAEGIDRLAAVLMRSGQLVPPSAAAATRTPCGCSPASAACWPPSSPAATTMKPSSRSARWSCCFSITPGPAEIRRIQAHESQREDLSMRDQ